MADGSTVMLDVFVAEVQWHGRPRRVEVDEADAQPLLGMGLMQGSDLRIDVVSGGSVSITERP